MTRRADADRKALGSDPFTQRDGTLPFLIRLRERTIRLAPSDEPSELEESERAKPGRSTSASGAAQSPTPPTGTPDLGPPVPEVGLSDEADPVESMLDRLAGWLLDPSIEDRVRSTVQQLGAYPYDPLGLSARAARRALAVFRLLYRYYFRVESSGHERIPEKGGVILAANHGGLLPFDAAMVIVDVMLRATPPRLPRAVVERWAGTLPFVNVFFARVGQVIGTRDNFSELLRNGQVVLVFPEGVEGIRKRAAERYVLQRFHLGFIEESLHHRVPIVPVAVVGPDDQAPILYDVKPLAKLLGLPVFPITPTFPLLGPIGLLPYPVRYEIRYGEPLHFYEEFSPDVIGDPHAIRYMAEQVRRRIQEIVDRRVLSRRSKKA
jgi:1-acyl-sn-glycerol-3-phosphate acyltransferase